MRRIYPHCNVGNRGFQLGLFRGTGRHLDQNYLVPPFGIGIEK